MHALCRSRRAAGPKPSAISALKPGRNGERIFQLPRGTPVVVLARAVADAAQAGDENSNEQKDATPDGKDRKREDWLLLDLFARRGSGGERSQPALSGENSTPAVTRASEGSCKWPVRAEGKRDPPVLTALSGTPIAGWVLARFIEPDLPGPVQDYASSANLHVVAWFELNRVPDGSGGEAPQYLVAGSRRRARRPGVRFHHDSRLYMGHGSQAL